MLVNMIDKALKAKINSYLLEKGLRLIYWKTLSQIQLIDFCIFIFQNLLFEFTTIFK